MDNHELIQKFNPNNWQSLTDDDRKVLRELSTEQIGVLAKAYPDNPQKRSYLVLHDKKLTDNKQLYQMSTFEKLYNLRKYSNMSNFSVFDFLENWKQTHIKQQPQGIRRVATQTTRVPVDLTPAQAKEIINKEVGKRAAPVKTTTTPAAPAPPVKSARKQATAKEKTAPKVTDKATVNADEDFTDPDLDDKKK